MKTLILTLLLTLCSAVYAQSKPIKIIVGFPPGSTTDTLARLISLEMSKKLNQSVIVENKPGAAGQLANVSVKQSTPDGNTLLMTITATMSVFPHLYKDKLLYNPFTDFVPVAHASNFQLGVGVIADAPVYNLKDYIKWVNSNPNYNGLYSTPGPGTIPHFFMESVARETGIKITHVPYKGTAQAMQALLAKEIPVIATLVPDVYTLAKSNKARLIAVAGERRNPSFPDVETFKENGFNLSAVSWYAFYAPVGTPPDRVTQLSNLIIDIVKDPEMSKKLIDMGLEPTGHDSNRLRSIMKQDFDHWGGIIAKSTFKVE